MKCSSCIRLDAMPTTSTLRSGWNKSKSQHKPQNRRYLLAWDIAPESYVGKVQLHMVDFWGP